MLMRSLRIFRAAPRGGKAPYPRRVSARGPKNRISEYERSGHHRFLSCGLFLLSWQTQRPANAEYRKAMSRATAARVRRLTPVESALPVTTLRITEARGMRI